MSSLIAWLGIWSLGTGMLLLVDFFVVPDPRGWLFVGAGTVLLALSAHSVRWRNFDPWFSLLALPATAACITWPLPHKAGPMLILAGWLLAIILRRVSWLTPASLGLGLAGMAITAQSGSMVAYWWLGARYHEATFLTPLFHTLGQLMGWTLGSSQGALFLPHIEGMIQATTTWERLGALPAMLLVSGGLVLVPLVQARTDRQILQRTAAAGVLCIGYLTFRYLVLTAAVAINGTPTAFWLPLPVALTFLPLSLLLARVLPLRTVLHEPVFPARRRPVNHYVALAILSFLAGISLLGLLTFPDPGQEKKGRVLLDEYQSNWEWTTQTLDTEWYGQKSGYNYYSLGQWLKYYYKVDTNFEPRTRELLQNYDVLIIKTPTAPFAPEEVDAIEGWVRAGGGLFLVGDHTNVFGTSSYLNPLARRFGLRFRYDSTYDLPTLRVTLFERPRLLAHPAVLEMPPFLFATSCTLEAPLTAGNVMVGYGLRALPVDYSKRVFFPDKEKEQDYPFGLFLQSASVRHGRGRVVAFTDSTVFSNFTMFLGGKPEYFLGVMNWLNRSEAWPWRDGVLLATIVLSGGVAVFLAWSLDRRRAGLVVLAALLLAAALGPWTSLQLARASYQLPEPHTQFTTVAFEGEHSRMLLPTSLSPNVPDASYQTFYVWTQRLGYVPSFAPTLEAALERANIMVLVDPIRPFEASEVEAVKEFVSSGGRLLVLAEPLREGVAEEATTEVLSAVGLGIEARRPTTGPIYNTSDELLGQLQVGGSITGGEPLLSIGGHVPIVARARHGEGFVVAAAFARLFSDREMGTTSVIPNEHQRFLFEIEFWLLRGLVTGEFPPLRNPAGGDGLGR